MPTVSALPRGDRRREDALATDDPVPVHSLGPLDEALVHVLGNPLDLLGAFEDGLLVHLDEPLFLREDLDRGVAAPARADGLLGGFGVVQVALRVEVVGDGLLRFVDGETGVVARLPVQMAVLGEDGAQVEVVLGPPRHVLFVPERTDHDGAAPELLIDVLVLDHLDLVAEERHLEGVVLAPVVTLVVRVDGHRDTGREQFGTGRRDLDVVVVHAGEGDVVERALAIDGFDLGVRDGGATARTPVNGVLVAVDEVVVRHLDEGLLRFAPVFGVHRAELGVPVLTEAEFAHRLLHRVDLVAGVLDAHLAELVARDVRPLDALVLLDLHFGRETVAVPSLREEDVVALQAVEARGEVHVRPVERVPDVEFARRVRRRRVHDVRRVGVVRVAVEPIRFLVQPALLEAGLYLRGIVVVWELGHGSGVVAVDSP